MRKPVKPERKATPINIRYDEELEKWTDTEGPGHDDISGFLDELTIKEAVEFLQQFDKDLVIKHNSGYDYSELVVQKLVKEPIEDFNKRLKKYEAEYAEWKEWKRQKLQKETTQGPVLRQSYRSH